jgi:hypothetical protein
VPTYATYILHVLRTYSDPQQYFLKFKQGGSSCEAFEVTGSHDMTILTKEFHGFSQFKYTGIAILIQPSSFPTDYSPIAPPFGIIVLDNITD